MKMCENCDKCCGGCSNKMFSHTTIDDPVVIPMANAFPWRVKVKTPVIGEAVKIDLRGLTEEDLVDGGLTREMAAALLADYFDHILVLMDKHGSNGYYHKDNDFIGFPDRGRIVWYKQVSSKPPVKMHSTSQEEDFNRLQNMRFNRLRK